MAHRPVGAGSSFNFSAGTATTSSAFTVQSSVLRVVAVGGAAHVAIGTNPTAAVTNYYVAANGTATLALTKASNRVVSITKGATTTIDFPEGTQAPFGVGDYVTLSAANDVNYTNVISHVPVTSVNTSSGVNGYHQTRIVVNANTAFITTAFSSADASLVTSQKIGAYGVGSGTLYYQQVQISGDA
jgi:hypothetical protein